MTALKASFPALRRSVMCFFKVCLTGHGCREHSLVTYGAKAALYVKRLTWCSDDSLNVLVTTPPKNISLPTAPGKLLLDEDAEAQCGALCWSLCGRAFHSEWTTRGPVLSQAHWRQLAHTLSGCWQKGSNLTSLYQHQSEKTQEMNVWGWHDIFNAGWDINLTCING